MAAVLSAVLVETERLILRPPVASDRAAIHGDAGVMHHIDEAAMDADDSWANLLRNAGH